jgi:hypothetical protein
LKRIELNLASAKLTKPHEYAMRFVFGGLCTALAGWIASRYGPAVGGLFLAFPAIFPASASLIETHEKERKTKIGSDGRNRGRMAAGLDSAGASMGCIGLFAFAFLLYRSLAEHNSYVVITLATFTWAIVAFLSWVAWNHRKRAHR